MEEDKEETYTTRTRIDGVDTQIEGRQREERDAEATTRQEGNIKRIDRERQSQKEQTSKEACCSR